MNVFFRHSNFSATRSPSRFLHKPDNSKNVMLSRASVSAELAVAA